MFGKKNMNKDNSGFSGRLLRLFDLLENIFLLLFAGGLYILTKEISWAKIVLWSGIIGLTFIYLLKSTKGPKEKITDYIIYKLLWIGYILSLFGVYAKLEMLEKNQMLLWIAIASVIIGTIGSIAAKFIPKKYMEKKDIIRSVVYLLITFLFAIL